jgi:proprotein convertase subtilisin/kexin type 5
MRTTPLTYANTFTDSCVIAMLCPSGYFGDNSSLACTQTCPTKTYGEPTTKTCDNCPQSCATCTSLSTCQSCEGTAVLASDGMCYGQCNSSHVYSYNGNCYLLCPTGTYLTSNNVICASCASMCLTCVGVSTNCTSCLGMFNYNG